jgi:hypothetical protein
MHADIVIRNVTEVVATSDLLPHYFIPSLVCRLLRCTSEFLVDAVTRGVVQLVPCAMLRMKIAREDVEKLLGRALTPLDVARSVEGRRAETPRECPSLHQAQAGSDRPEQAREGRHPPLREGGPMTRPPNRR